MLEKIFQKNETIINYIYLFNKLVLINLASFFSFSLRFTNEDYQKYFIISVFLSAIILLLEITKYNDERFYSSSMQKFILRELNIFFISILILIFFSALLKITNQYSRLWLSIFILQSVIFLIIHKILFNKFYKYLIETNIFTKNVLLIGEFEECKSLLKKFKDDSKYHFRISIFLDKKTQSKLFPIQQISLDNNLQKHINFYSISQIWIIASDGINLKKIKDTLSSYPIDIRTIYQNDSFKNQIVEKTNGYLIYDSSLSPFYGLNYLSKLFIDIVLSSLLIVLVSPILIIVSFLIVLEDGMPFLFIQKRHGWDGSEIKIFKLRSLKQSRSTAQVGKNDKRLLKIGKFIRKYSIDELPQFFNVLKGDMSIVGPRPHALAHNDEFSKKIRGFMNRHRCKPGITGLAQVRGSRGEINNKAELQFRYHSDLEYLKNWSLWLDISIIIKTAFIFLFQKAN